MVGFASGDWSPIWLLSEQLQDTCSSKALNYLLCTFSVVYNIEGAKEIFSGTGIAILTEGEHYLGGAVGTSSFVNEKLNK